MIWDKIREAFAHGQRNLKIENQSRKTFDLCMTGIISKDNAINNLLDYHKRTRNQNLQIKIISQIKTIWNK